MIWFWLLIAVCTGLLVVGLLVGESVKAVAVSERVFMLPPDSYEHDLSEMRVMCQKCGTYGTIATMRADSLYGTVCKTPCTPSQEAA